MPQYLGSAIILHVPAKRVGVEIGLRRGQFRWALIDRLERHRGPHLLRLLGGKQAGVTARNLTVRQLHEQPAGHVVGADRQAAGWRRVAGQDRFGAVRLLPAKSDDRAVEPAMRVRAVHGRLKFYIRVGRVVHPQRCEHMGMHELLPRLAADRFDQLAGNHVEDIVVGITAAKTGRRLDEAQAPHRLLARQIAVGDEQKVARAKPEAAAMNEQIAHRHLARHPRIPHAEIGHMVDDLVVPFQLALVDQDGERGDGEGLARRAGAEDRVRADALGLADLAHAPALRERRLAILDDGDRHARRAVSRPQLFNALRKPGGRGGVRGRGDGQQRGGD